jgi:hypothetical protein
MQFVLSGARPADGPAQSNDIVSEEEIVAHVANHGSGCPFLTMFGMPTADYQAARASFKESEAEASRKVEQLKKNLGEKWDEVTGKKS